MEKLDNTGLGLIKATIERVQNSNSLFTSGLKKLVNSSEEELSNFLNVNVKVENQANGILRRISGRHTLALKALDGKRLIYNSMKTFKASVDPNFKKWNLNKTGMATPETLVQVSEMVGDGTFMKIFSSLPGIWKQKWVSQNQVIEFCETLSNWLRHDEYDTMFLIKKDENKPINEDNPQDNLVVVNVCVHPVGLYVNVFRLENGYVWSGGRRRRVVSLQLNPSVS